MQKGEPVQAGETKDLVLIENPYTLLGEGGYRNKGKTYLSHNQGGNKNVMKKWPSRTATIKDWSIHKDQCPSQNWSEKHVIAKSKKTRKCK